MNKILIISINPFYGGGEAFIVNTIKPLSNKLEIHYLVKNPQLIEQLGNNVQIIKSNNIIKQIQEIKKVIQNIQPELTIYNGGSSLYISIFLQKKKILIRHTTNDCISLHQSPKLWFHKILLYWSYMKANKVIHVSNFSKNEQYFFKNKAITIHNGIKLIPPIKKQPSKPIHLLYVGRIDKSKGIDIIIKAVANFSPDQIILDVVGDGNYMNELRKIKPINVVLHGFCTHPEKFYPSADAFISLPIYENLSLSILEAMNHSLMVITCPVGGMPELIKNGINGIIINRTVKDVTKAIEQIIATPKMLIEYGNNSKSICDKEFNLKNKIEQYYQTILKVLNS